MSFFGAVQPGGLRGILTAFLWERVRFPFLIVLVECFRNRIDSLQPASAWQICLGSQPGAQSCRLLMGWRGD